jgi:AraC-like DNA-binding protein
VNPDAMNDTGGESALRVQSAAPVPALRPFVRAYVQREARLGGVELVEPVVARLGVMLEFEFAGAYEVRNYGTETLDETNPISIIGPQSWRRARLIIRGHIESLVILFQPAGFSGLFGVPTAPLAERGTEGHSVLGGDVSRLHERLGNLGSLAERVEVLDGFLLARVAKISSPDRAEKALQRLTVPGLSPRVGDVAWHAGYSRRQLERKALAATGMTPKLLTRISRFSHALRLRTESSLSWTEIAHSASYHDHMHMIRDFRQFAGEAPSSALRELAPDHLIHYCAR